MLLCDDFLFIYIFNGLLVCERIDCRELETGAWMNLSLFV